MGASPITALVVGASTDASVSEAAQPSARTSAIDARQDKAILSPTAQALQLHQHGVSLEAIAAVLDTTIATVENYLNIQVSSIPATEPPTSTPAT